MWDGEDTWPCSIGLSHPLPQLTLMTGHDKGPDNGTLAYRVKVAILGDWSVGKTSILNCLCDRFTTGDRGKMVDATIGVEFLTHSLDFSLSNTTPNTTCQDQDPETWTSHLYLWDTSGTERYRSLITPYLKNVGILIIAFDVCDSTTWKHVDYWRQLGIEHAQKSGEQPLPGGLPLVCLIGCKADNPDIGQVVSCEEIAAKAAEWNCPWWKVSTHSTIKLEGTPPAVVGSTRVKPNSTAKLNHDEDGDEIVLAENIQSKSVWSHFLTFSRRLTPREQMATVFGHMAVQFHRLAKLVGHSKLPYETCSLGPKPIEPPTIGNSAGQSPGILKIDRRHASGHEGHRRRKSGCCE